MRVASHGLALLGLACLAGAGCAGTGERPGVDLSGLTIEVYYERSCGCCGAWMDYLRAGGAAVVEHASDDDLAPLKDEYGVPEQARSCHTATTGGYVVEGHVPGEAIVRLLDARPDATGIALPGMPADSPGMGGNSASWIEQPVLLIGPDGDLSAFDYSE